MSTSFCSKTLPPNDSLYDNAKLCVCGFNLSAGPKDKLGKTFAQDSSCSCKKSPELEHVY